MLDREQMMRRQKVLADFGEFVLQSEDLDAVLTEACRLVGEALGTARAKILEIQEEGQCFFVRAGIGWGPHVVGHLRLPMSERSSETYAIEAGKPVIMQDIRKEERFVLPEFLKEGGVVALANVPIFVPGGQAYGLLQVDASEPRDFGEEDTQFLRTYASLLGPVIDRLHKVGALRRQEERFRAFVSSEVFYRMSPDWSELRHLDGRGFLADSREPSVVWMDCYIPPDDQPVVKAAIERAVRTKSQFDLEHRVQRLDGSFGWTASRAVPLLNEQGKITEWLGAAHDITARKVAEEALKASESRAKLLLAELQHRVRNTLAVIRSIARRSAETSDSVENYAMHLDGRIDAFASVQATVTRNPSAGVALDMLVADNLLAVGAHEGEQVRHIQGPKVRLKVKAAETVALALHELATNAVKYGALSAEQGQIAVEWHLESAGEHPRLMFHWIETGVKLLGKKPARSGFGTELIERTLAYELGGIARLRFMPDGLHCTINLPADGTILLEEGQPVRRS